MAHQYLTCSNHAIQKKKKIATINITISPKLSIIAIKFEETISNLTVHFFSRTTEFYSRSDSGCLCIALFLLLSRVDGL